MKMRLAALALTALLQAGCAVAQPGPGPGPGLRQGPNAGPQLPPPPITPDMSEAALAASLDGWMSGLAEQQLFSGAVLVRHDGRDVWSKAYGLANRSASLAATVDTPFNFGSIGKILTHTAIIQLAEAGKLSLDDTVGKWLPAYPQAVSRTATIEQLIGHRGGIADFFGPAFARTPKSQFTANRAYYDLISHQPPLFAPGEREQYCNGCYAVLGEIIAAATGVRYETYVRDNILLPAGMTHTVFAPPASAARPYGRPRPDMDLQDVSNVHGAAASAAGGSFATLRDLAAFNDALRDNKLTRAPGTAAILRADAPANGRATKRHGIGGGAPGVNAILTSNGSWTVITLANLDPPAAEAPGSAIFRALAGPSDRP